MQLDFLFVIKSGLARDKYNPDHMIKDELASVGGSTDLNDPKINKANVAAWLLDIQNTFKGDPAITISVPYCEIDWVNGPPTGMARGVVGMLRIVADSWDKINQVESAFSEKVRAHVAAMNGIDADEAKAYQIQQNDMPDKTERTLALWGIQPLSTVVSCFMPDYNSTLLPNTPNRYAVHGFIGGVGGKH